MARSLCGDFYTFGPRIGVSSNMPIRGKPFRAEYEEVHSRAATGEVIRRRGVIYRDGKGRMRREDVLEEPGKPGSRRVVATTMDPDRLVARIFDSLTEKGAELDLGRALRGRNGGPTPTSCPAPSEPQGQAESDPSREPLGTKVIEGFPCHGIRIASGQEEIENWLSGDLAMLLLEVAECPDFQTLYRVFNIKLEEPDPNLFALPKASHPKEN